METEGPYTYPLTDRADIIEFLGEHEAYVPMETWNGGFVLAWNIKLNGRTLDTSGAAYREEFGFEARFDEAWENYVEEDDMMFYEVCADATRMYTDEEWTRYPGVEQGEYKFGINGRSGGYMILEDWPGRKPNRWACFPMVWSDHDDYLNWLEEFEDGELKLFYRVVVQLDQDLSRESCFKEIEYQYAFRRGQWENEMREGEEIAACKLEASRPDMYGTED